MDFMNSLVLTYAFILFAFGLAFIYQALANWLREKLKAETRPPLAPASATKTYRLIRIADETKRRAS